MFSSLPWLLHTVRHLDRKLQIEIFLTGFGLIWILIGLFLLVKSSANTAEVLPEANQFQTQDIGKLSVDVSGAVQQPGMYQLDLHARVGDAIALAGGPAETADHEQFAQKLNLAEKVQDGQKIFVPFAVEQKTAASTPQSLVESNIDSDDSFQISFNSATAKELESLPGIGTKKASDVIGGRPYTTLNEVRETIKVSDDVWIEVLKHAKL